MSGSPDLPQYDDWSPGASWRAAEERSRGSETRRALRLPQRIREPAGGLPVLSTRHQRFAACALALGLVGLFATRALHLHVTSSSNRATVPAVKPEARTFAWVPVPGARSYVVEFVGHGGVIYLSRTQQPRLNLAAVWTYRGRRHALRPGVYHWNVWPILRTAKGAHRGRASVSSTMTIPG